MQRCMLRMTALIQYGRISFLARQNRDQHRTLRMMLAKVVTKSALSVMNCLHNILLLSLNLTHDHAAPLHHTS